MSILVVDNDENKNRKLQEKLRKCGYECEVVESIQNIAKKLEEENYKLILINWNKAHHSVEFIYDTKVKHKKISIIILEKEYNKVTEIQTLNSGADDYMQYPLLDSDAFNVLKARMEARLRFGGTNVIDLDDLIIDPDEEKIFYNDKEIELKGKPFEVLTHLAKQRGQIVSKEQLLDAIWEEPELVTPNVIEVAINQIRQRMDKPLGIGTIETIRRRGYRFCYPNCAEIGTIKSE